MYQIFTDATTDFLPQDVTALDITVLPMEYVIDGQTYRHTPADEDLSPNDFYQAMRQGKMPTTSQIPAAQYEDWFAPVLESGQDLLFICFSSALTGSYNNACLAAKEMMEQYPDRKVLVVDSLAASRGEGLLVEECVALRRQGKSLDYVFNWAMEARSNIQHWVTVDDLNHLKRGGRISAASAVIGGVLGIKPIIRMDEHGALVPVDKVRGRKASIDYLVDRFAQSYLPDRGTVYVAHGDCLEDAEYCAKQIKEKTGVKNVAITMVGPIIGAHTGPGIVAILYIGKKQ
ncbi:MAG: DegV family protein [Oscillospiraceae bacterium]|nr:DegV family protein [Oscillospiraceae bacterium]